MRRIFLPPPIAGVPLSKVQMQTLCVRLRHAYPDVIGSGATLRISAGWAWIGIEIIRLLRTQTEPEERMRVFPLTHLDFGYMDDGPVIGLRGPSPTANAIAEHARILTQSTCENCGVPGRLYKRRSFGGYNQVLCRLCSITCGEELILVDGRESQ